MTTITYTQTSSGTNNGYHIVLSGAPGAGETYTIKAYIPGLTTIATYTTVSGDTETDLANALYVSLNVLYQNGQTPPNAFNILIPGTIAVITYGMGLVLKSEPPKIATAHNDLIFVVDSDNKLNTNYKYICDVYINSVRVARLKNNPNPNFANYGIFNVKKIIQSYISSDYFNAPPVLSLINPYVIFQVKFSERFEAGGTQTENDDVITSANKYAYNASFPYAEAPIFLDGSQSNTNLLHLQFITNRPSPISVPPGADFYMTGFTSTPDISVIIFSLKVTTYTGLNQTGTSSTTTFPAGISKNNDFIGNFGPNGLSNAGISLTGIQSYKVDLFVNNVILEDTLLFNIDLCEPKYEVLHFVFLNKIGGYESLYLTKQSRKTVTIDRKVMQSLGTVYNTSNFTLDYRNSNNVFYESFKTFGAKYSDKLKVNTDWLTDNQYKWLTELLTSDVIYLQQTIPASVGVAQTSAYMPCRLTTNEFEVKKKVNEKLTQVELEFETGFNNYSQLR